MQDQSGASGSVKPEIGYEVFASLDLRMAKVISARKHEGADRLTILEIDVGELGKRQIVAGIAKHYEPEDLVGKTIVVLVNLKPVKLRGEESQGMLLATTGDDRVVLLTAMEEVPPGWPVS